MKTILFLDLENTIIDTWDNRNICSNWKSIKSWISCINFDEVHVFSYAIWNQDDIRTFKDSIAPSIEEVLKIRFNDKVLDVDLMRVICANHLKIRMNKDDFFTFMKKEISFRIICEENFSGCECILLDDMVIDSILSNRDTGTIIKTYNVKNCMEVI